MSPMTNQAHAVSGLYIAVPRTSICCTLSANPTTSLLTPMNPNSLPNYSAISNDSPTYQQGILRAIGDKMKCLSCCWKAAIIQPGGETSTFDEEHSEQFERLTSTPIDIVPPVPLSSKESQAALISCNSGATSKFMKAVRGLHEELDLIGDYSRPFALPLVQSRHPDLKAISSETLVKLIQGEFSDSVKDFLVVDCRYPYEYDGGHITGAKNIYNKDGIYSTLLSGAGSLEMGQRSIIIFHCEFSSYRAPTLLRFLHNKDRELNKDVYPRLYHPEIYILKGGYRHFYDNFKNFCEPQDYVIMLDVDHTEERKMYNRKWNSEFNGNTQI